MFTNGNSRSYEFLMKKIPCDNRNSGNSRYALPMSKYRYRDLACRDCLHYRNKMKCKFKICPYIVENLDELADDKAFIHALANAESCTNGHKQALLRIKLELVVRL